MQSLHTTGSVMLPPLMIGVDTIGRALADPFQSIPHNTEVERVQPDHADPGLVSMARMGRNTISQRTQDQPNHVVLDVCLRTRATRSSALSNPQLGSDPHVTPRLIPHVAPAV